MSKNLMSSLDFVNQYAKSLSLKGIQKAILCFVPSTAKKIQDIYKGERIYSLGACWDIYPQHKTVVLSQFGLGSPATLLQVEYLRVLKIPHLFSIGSLASFKLSLNKGEAILIQKAYKESLDFKNLNSNRNLDKNRIKTQKAFNKMLVKNPYIKETQQLIKELSLSPQFTVSCDRPYQITSKDYKFYISKKISGLEMEAHSLISASIAYKIPLLCLAVVSDFLSDTKWDRCFSHKKVQQQLVNLLEKLLHFSFKI